jgi:protein involved in polysaccharide export with SLBB domain
MKKIVFLLYGIIIICSLHAQSISSLKSVDVDNLSDDQISSIMQKMQSEGVSTSQLDQYAASKGVSQDQVDKLKTRIVQYSNKKNVVKNHASYNISDSLPENEAALLPKEKKPQLFGASIFKNVNLSFEPDLRLATPQDYVLGPNDEVIIDIYGVSEVSRKLTVSPEGTILIPYAGLVTVGGLTIGEAKKVIKAKLGKVYGGIGAGNTSVSITLGNIRSITVNVIGEIVYPGSYTISSLATVFNALYQSGGPTENGSFRDIQVIRNNQVIATVDLYDFLVYGKQANLRLQDQDALKVLPYRNRVTLAGEVKTPGIFEMKKGETLQNLIEFAGGFTENAYRESITGYRNTLKEKSVIDINNSEFATFRTEGGDEYKVGQLLNRFANRVQIGGAVYRPGAYSLTPGMKIKDLILKADGFKEDAFLNSAVVFREDSARVSQMTSFSPREVMNGINNILLQRDDSVYIASTLDMKERGFVYISGEVMAPDRYPFAEGMTVKDLILLADGVKSRANTEEIEVYRQITDVKTLNENVNKSESFKLKMSKDMDSGEAATFQLKREDRVVVRTIFGAEDVKEVQVEGEVIAPGNYVLKAKNQRISDLVRQAGGLTAYAYPTGAFLIRQREKLASEQKMLESTAQTAVKFQKYVNAKKGEDTDTTKMGSVKQAKQNILDEPNMVAIDLQKILKHPGSKYDLQLEAGDVLSIPKLLETVSVTGEVLRPAVVRYQAGKSLRSYIDNAGGFGQQAYAGKTYVVHANGSVGATSHFLGIPCYPRVTPGSRIIVPEKPVTKGMTTAESISITSSIVSLAVIIVAMFKK